MNKLTFLVLAMLPLTAIAQSDDDFGLDISVEAEKKLWNTIDFAIEGDVRTQDNTGKIERYTIGGTLSKKIVNTKKFDMKLSAGWEYLWQNKLSECENHYEEETQMTPTGEVTELIHDGYNVTDGFWRPRHRTSLGISADYEPNKRWNFSLKETVQYNHYSGVTKTTRRYRFIDEENPSLGVNEKDPRIKEVTAKDRFVLRSKATVKYDVRNSHFAPFASFDFGCGLNYNVAKYKYTIGTDYNLSKTNKLSLYYRFQTENDDDEPNGHIVGLGYSIKL